MPPSRWPPRVVLVAVGTDAAASLVQRAHALALLCGSKLVLAHAVRVRSHETTFDSGSLLESLEILDVEAHQRVAVLARSASEGGVYVSTVIMHGDPLRVLEDAIRTEQADLVIVGSRRRPANVRPLRPPLASELSARGHSVLGLPVSGAES